MNVIYQEETLRNVIRSVTRNGRSIILTAILALILVYLFSIIGFLFFRDDFLLEVDSTAPLKLGNDGDSGEEQQFEVNLKDEPIVDHAVNKSDNSKVEANYCFDKKSDCSNGTTKPNSAAGDGGGAGSILDDIKANNQKKLEQAAKDEGGSVAKADDEEAKERACDTLLMCIITTMNHGLRNGGGIGDVLRSPSANEPLFVARVVYDLLFYFVVIIIILNLIFGVIIDTFADLRSEKQQKEEILKNTCFICGKLLA